MLIYTSTGPPYVTMKGEFILSWKIKILASKNDVPIIENVPLARALYSKIGVDQSIIDEFVEPVADVIRWLRAHEKQV
ncbi:EscU/YscU/HrcU family type III secretion system export apparatus switch protein [Microbulbifer sp. VAAC004]|uniref:EscU/YscU/HrcU family type III secretion system export apparatus switch protein n=1 Tax=unclassified Microbulbifer TaxID=2619833 RepID=UPI00403B217C